MNDDILIYDIETKTYGMPDANKDRFRLFGCYSYKTNKSYLLTNLQDVQKIFDAHKFIVGFNNEKYDNIILAREGINLKYKINIDLMDIFIKRSGQMKIKEGILKDLLMEYSLRYITQTLGLVEKDNGKMEIDYNIFKKDSWTTEEMEQIKLYTLRDIEVTKKLYEWCEKYFESFKHYLNTKDVEHKVYLTAGFPKLFYKAVCKELCWEEVYSKEIDETEAIEGGYVSYPAGEKFSDNIYCFDYNSLYPSIMISCNIYGRCKTLSDRPTWNGNNIWKVEGNYFSDKQSEVSNLLKKWFLERIEFKKQKDPRDYALKIYMNIGYGVLNTIHYQKVYDKVGGGDITRLGRQWIMYFRKCYRDKGYKIVYSDTDSIYIKDPYNDINKVMEIKDDVIKYIKSTVPFPFDEFDAKLEYKIKHIFFFKGSSDKEDEHMDVDDYENKRLGLMKKNYIFVTDDNKLVIKNLGINKKSNSLLSRKIFNEFLKPQIIEKGEIKFSKIYISDLINKLLKEDIGLIQMRKEVGPMTQYEKSPTSLPAQISAKYGEGIHFLIPNTKGIGVGKGKSYCTMKEFKENNLTLKDVDLENVWSELSYFLREVPQKDIFSYGDKK